jgi:iron complex outermembrane receptor protein/hemoglobin/transferrin/lactoferrin receptor protein
MLLICAISPPSLAITPFFPPDSLQLDTILVDLILHREVTIIGHRFEQQSFNRPEAIASFGGNRLLQLSPTSLPDAMAHVPGVWMQKTNLGGGSPFIRGLTGYQTLLMVDGIRLNNATFRSGPNQYLNTIDPLSVQRIEVMRGSGSVQFGSDAIGGAAQMLTKSPVFSADGFRVSGSLYSKYMQGGMEKTGRAELMMATDKIAFLGGASYKNLGDLVAGGNLGMLTPTGYQDFAIDLKASWKIAPATTVTALFQRVNQTDVPLYHQIASGSFQQYLFAPQRRNLGYVRVEHQGKSALFSAVKLTLLYQQSLEKRLTQRTNQLRVNREEDNVQTLGMVSEILSKPTSFWTISSGLEVYSDHVTSTRIATHTETGEVNPLRGLFADGSTMLNYAVYSLHQLDQGRWDFTAGLRYNGFQIQIQEPLFNNPRVSPQALVGNASVAYTLHPQHRIIASVNSAFRAPNISDLSTLGVADFRYEVPAYGLRPEQSVTVELGYKVKTSAFSGALYVYQNNLTDLITNVRGTFNGQDSINGIQVYKRVNAQEAVLRGAEAEMEWLVHPSVLFYGNVAYTYGQNISDNEPMRRIPPLFGRTGVRYQSASGLRFQADWTVAGRQGRLAKGDRDDNRMNPEGTPAWQIVDLQAGYKYRHWMLNGGLQNLFNEAYRMHGSGIDGLGRSYWVSLLFSW